MRIFMWQIIGMLHLRKVIQKISEKDSKELIFWIKQNDAEKCAQMFSLMRESELEESEIAAELQASPTSFYSLKSRLNRKIQEFFAHNVPDTNIDLLKNVANIPNLLFNSPREIAITHLLKMEKELVKHDMPYALTTVYSALKKLHRYSQKYFDYTQLYNKHLAYTMAIDKAKELLADFNKTLGEYIMSRDEKLLEMLGVIRQEIRNYAQLYKSHRLVVYQNILEVEFGLFAAPEQKEKPGMALDAILTKTDKILKSYKYDANYFFMQPVINFLWFQYYHQYGLHKKALEYFEQVNEKLPLFLLNNFCCFPSVFLLAKAEVYAANHQEQKLYEECKLLAASFTPDMADTPNYINYVKFRAIAAFYSTKYNECISVLNGLLNEVSFRSFPHAEIEVKLFLSVCYMLMNKFELANAMIKNVQRKLRDFDPGEYRNARAFAKMLVVSIDYSVKANDKKLLKLREEFQSLNRNQEKMLTYIRLDEGALKSLQNHSTPSILNQALNE
jgi:hypothetical protein